ncbi:Carboxypeptidase B [Frankliniella fusca]|uniref:Zinc carboxypeptidase A 1 n=1 Tax=Frankliniella fusca TaxID=407009 RepID=A0AAE1LC92_9NEOP|nr:Carboxypeptidase B [Frankliniella fusca]
MIETFDTANDTSLTVRAPGQKSIWPISGWFGEYKSNMCYDEKNEMMMMMMVVMVIMMMMENHIFQNLIGWTCYTVVRVTPTTDEQVLALLGLAERAPGSGPGQGVQWWTPPRRNAPCDAMISPDSREEVIAVLGRLGLAHSVLHRDLQDSIEAVDEADSRERARRSTPNTRRQRGRRRQAIPFTSGVPALPYRTPSTLLLLVLKHPVLSAGRYQTRVDKELQPLLASRFAPGDAYINNQRYLDFEEIDTYITQLQLSHPNKVKLHLIGYSYEKRPMRVVHLSNCFECKYKAVWVDAGIHAREWIAPATALFALSQLAENETATAEMREHQDWYILPVANPDGYEFTHKKDRMWRKTRSNTSVPNCFGADPNRNFDFHWNVVGASNNPCSETYAGRHALSEIEAKNIRNFLWDNRERFKLYISYHAYGNFLLYPWGYTADNPSDWQLLKSVAEKVNAAMELAGSQPYTIGSSTQTLYAAAGGSDDWAKGVAGIPLSYTIELPGYDFGFQLPPRYIDEVARQSFEGLRVFAAEAKKFYLLGDLLSGSGASMARDRCRARSAVPAGALALARALAHALTVISLLHPEAAAGAGLLSDVVSYENHKVFRVVPSTHTQVTTLNQLLESAELDAWTKSRELDSPWDIMVNPLAAAELRRALQEHQIKWEVLIPDVAKTLQRRPSDPEVSSRSSSGTTGGARYLRYKEVVEYLDDLAKRYPERVTVKSIGKTSENRDLKVIQISSVRDAEADEARTARKAGGEAAAQAQEDKKTRPAVWIDAGIHAREWIAPATALYIIHQLVENATFTAGLTRDVDWHVLPLMNPDGYEYSHTTDRLWRKTRSKTWWGLGCAGADANRNFDFHWREVGASWSACSYTYAGSKAFSEPEARAVRDYLLANKDRMKMYLTYHSYGNDSLAKKANKAMVAAGSDPYTIGSSTNVLYAAAGGSDDWAKGVAGIELSYTIELPGGNGHGFDLPASYIPDVGRQQMELIKVFGKYVASLRKQ